MTARTSGQGWWSAPSAAASKASVPANALMVSRSGSRCTAMSMKASGTAIRASQARAASSQPDVTRAAMTASTSAVTSSAARRYGPIRALQCGQRPVTGSSEHHSQRPASTWREHSGHARRGALSSVLRANTLALILGPASRPAAAAAMIHGSVTFLPRSVAPAGPARPGGRTATIPLAEPDPNCSNKVPGILRAPGTCLLSNSGSFTVLRLELVGVYVPTGWPQAVRPPGSEDFESSAVSFPVKSICSKWHGTGRRMTAWVI